MSLVPFHRGLIATAIVFCLGYGGWEIAAYLRDGTSSSLVVGTIFLLLGAGLGYYLARLKHFLGYGEKARGRE